MKTINSLTSMRGLAALWVVAFHLWALGVASGYMNWARFGWSGVAFFFVLSGYLLIRKWKEGDYLYEGKTSLKLFYTKRIFRTWPLYYICLTLITFVFGLYDFRILSYFFAQEYFPSTFDRVVFWTLCVEEAFYFSLPILMKYVFCSKNRVILSTILGGILSVATYYGLPQLGYTIPNTVFVLPFWFVAYGFGAMIAFDIKIRVGKWMAIIIFFMAAFMLQSDQGSVITAIASSAVYYFLIIEFETSTFLNTNRILIYLGKISYSLYIWHTFIIDARWLSINEPFEYVLALGASILVAMASYHLIEQPFRNLGQWLIQRYTIPKIAEPLRVH